VVETKSLSPVELFNKGQKLRLYNAEDLMIVVIEFESRGRKQMRYNLRYYPSIYLNELIKTRNNFRQDSG